MITGPAHLALHLKNLMSHVMTITVPHLARGLGIPHHYDMIEAERYRWCPHGQSGVLSKVPR